MGVKGRLKWRLPLSRSNDAGGSKGGASQASWSPQPRLSPPQPSSHLCPTLTSARQSVVYHQALLPPSPCSRAPRLLHLCIHGWFVPCPPPLAAGWLALIRVALHRSARSLTTVALLARSSSSASKKYIITFSDKADSKAIEGLYKELESQGASTGHQRPPRTRPAYGTFTPLSHLLTDI